MSTPGFAPPVVPTYFRGLSESELCHYFQSQLPDHKQGCGPFAISMAANLFNGKSQPSSYPGAQVEALLERKWLKIHGFGMPTWFGFRKGLKLFVQGRVDQKSRASLWDIQSAIMNYQLPIVAVSWQSTKEIISDLKDATVGHYMVVVGFDTTKNQIFFLNPGIILKEGLSHLYSISYQEFDNYWNKKRNIFIIPGSMWTISG